MPSPDNQQQLVDLLIEATEKTMRGIEGFVSANVHKSLDGKHVVNYAQWRSRDDFEAMLQNPEALEYMRPIQEIATDEANLYEVVEAVAVE